MNEFGVSQYEKDGNVARAQLQSEMIDELRKRGGARVCSTF